LKSGGHLVMDQSEALTAIDVNTGRFTGKRDLEETILKTNLEAVREVVYQLRFRNIGGLIIIDLIDMETAAHREKVYRALQDALRHDKARTNILKISELGLVEMTRKRTRENLLQTLCEPCSHCEGRGYVLSGASVAFKVLREIRNDLPRFCGRRIAISVSPRVAEMLLSHESKPLHALEQELGREIEIRARPGLHQEQFELEALDGGPAVEVKLGWLRDPAEIAAEEEAAEKAKADKSEKKNGRGSRNRGGRRRGRGRGEDAEEENDDENDSVAAAEPEPITATPEGDGGADSGRSARVRLRLGDPGVVLDVGDAVPVDEPDAEAEAAPASAAEPVPGEPDATPSETARPAGLSLERLDSDPPQISETLDDEAESRILPRPDETR
jgi:hypothetical protein